jgi:PAS domain S-box-containing protein
MSTTQAIILTQDLVYAEKLINNLYGLGYDSLLSSNNTECLDLTLKLQPQILIWGEELDIHSKKRIREIKNSEGGSAITVIALSNAASIELYEKIEAQHYGIDDIILKNTDFAELKSRIYTHRIYAKELEHFNKKTDRYRQLSDITFNLMLSQGLDNLVDIGTEYLVHVYANYFLIFCVYTPTLDDFSYFNINPLKLKTGINPEHIRNHPVWQEYFLNKPVMEQEEITALPLLKCLRDWGFDFEKVQQFPLQYKGKTLGVLLLSFSAGKIFEPDDQLMLTAFTQALAYRITEIRRFYGLDRHSQKVVSDLSSFFQRPTNDEILVALSQQLNTMLQTDICLFMNYHEGFRFLYPKVLYQGESTINQLEKEKPPVLLIKDFPTFENVLTEKRRLLFDLVRQDTAVDLKNLPGFHEFSVKNIVIFPISVAQNVQGFFVLGRESIIKKFTKQEIDNAEQMINLATESLEENDILRQAKLTVKQLERIFELGTELTLDVSIDNILKKICAAVRRTLGWNVVILDIRDPYKGNYKTVNILGMPEKDYQALIKSTQQPLFEKRINSAYKIANSYFFDHTRPGQSAGDSGNVSYKQMVGTEWNDQDWIYVPISSRGNVLGMISLNDPVERLRPTEDRLRSIEFFANQAAVVIENAQLFEQLKSSELRYRILAETMTMGLVTCDLKGRILYVNNSLTRTLKYNDKAELLQKKIYDLSESNSVHKIEKEVMRAISTEDLRPDQKAENSGAEIELIARDKETIPFMMYTSPLYQQDQRVGFFGVLSDLRNQKKIERMRADFNSMIVHDLRSPLNIIQGYVDIVRTEVVGKVNEEQAELLGIAKENVFKLLRLIENFLIASKLEAGHMEIQPELNSINSMLETVYDHFQVLTKEKEIKFIKELDENIPYLSFDKFRLEQVMRNYLSNALKFTPPGGTISMASYLKKKKNELTHDNDLFVDVTVTDSGVGISEKEINKVFNKYEQTEAGKDASLKGTGLGLAICREIIELHKGEVWVKSKLNEGSIFGFTLPIQKIII